MKKNFIVILIVTILCSGMLFAANDKGMQSGNIKANKVVNPSPADKPTLTLQWNLKKDVETYEFGFTNAVVDADSGVVKATSTLSMNEVKTFEDIHATAETYVYWILDTKAGIKIDIGGSGPLKIEGTEDNKHCIAWQATFNPVTVDTYGKQVPERVPVSIGTTTPAEDATNTDYADKTVFQMSSTNAVAGTRLKRGSAKVDIITQNIFASEPEDGAYAATLTLTVTPSA